MVLDPSHDLLNINVPIEQPAGNALQPEMRYPVRLSRQGLTE